jgi:hypothetical protein
MSLFVGWMGQLLIRRLLRFSLETLQEADTRPPVLFLRAFRDDQVPLRTPKLALLGRLLDVGRRAASLDQLLLEEGTPTGPVVGLGSPTDKRPPYGAARGYFTGETWRDAVAGLAAASAFTVICVDDTDGIWWEVGHLAEGSLDKTLFLIHPRYRNETDNAAILVRLAVPLAIPGLQGAASGDPIVGFYSIGGCGQMLHSTTFSRFAYLMALRVFIRHRAGLLDPRGGLARGSPGSLNTPSRT